MPQVIDSLETARGLDQQDPLSNLRQKFSLPTTKSGEEQVYFAGHSLGLMPRQTPDAVAQECRDWAALGVEGHFEAKSPWLPYHEVVAPALGRLVGAKENEVVAMNTLTVNLHLLLVSFYRPTKSKYKILIENNTFPSDKYAVDSQARFHGFDPREAVVELKPRTGEITVREEDLLAQIADLGDSLAVVMLGNCNYLSGQRFPFEKIVKAGHAVDALVGFNLAHGAGNLALKLHDWAVDFAMWCSYKYLNSGPGGIAGAFVHERHLGQKDLPRFEGWWGHDKRTRFQMGPDFHPLPTVEAWQLSNPPIFQLAALRSSLDIFDSVGMQNLRDRGDRLTGALRATLEKNLSHRLSVVTPQNCGSMLCLRIKGERQPWAHLLREKGILVDFREPDIIRATPVPLYNNYEDIYRFQHSLHELLEQYAK